VSFSPGGPTAVPITSSWEPDAFQPHPKHTFAQWGAANMISSGRIDLERCRRGSYSFRQNAHAWVSAPNGGQRRINARLPRRNPLASHWVLP
jgi:hypothetical protein